MPVRVTILYPTSPAGATFSMEYYLTSHMPLVFSLWKSFGMDGYSVQRFGSDPATGAELPFSVAATLDFESMDKWKGALANAETAGKIMGDIPNFSNREPIILPGEVVGTS